MKAVETKDTRIRELQAKMQEALNHDAYDEVNKIKEEIGKLLVSGTLPPIYW